PIQPGGGTRGRQLTTAVLDEALASSNVQPHYLIEISQTREVPAPTGPTRSTNYGEPALIVHVPATGPEWGQVLLYIDESGVVTWNFPRATDNSLDTSRGQGTKTFVIPRYVAPPPSGGTRGLAGSLGSKVLKVVVFPLLEPAIGAVGDYFVARWEQKNRPYRIRSFTPENYQSGDVQPLDGGAWAKLSGERGALLIVHGTGSQAHTGFGELPADYVRLLNSSYEGRVFAF